MFVKKLEFCTGDFRALKTLVLATFAGVPLSTSDAKASDNDFSHVQKPPVLQLEQGMLTFAELFSEQDLAQSHPTMQTAAKVHTGRV